jgi:hypothetical protein
MSILLETFSRSPLEGSFFRLNRSPETLFRVFEEQPPASELPGYRSSSFPEIPERGFRATVETA